LVQELISIQPSGSPSCSPSPWGKPQLTPSFRPMNVAAVNCQTEILAYLISEGGDVMDCGNFRYAERRRGAAALRPWSS
jgi:alpha-tubulin suppressor-like RCC1 family protein